MNDMKEFWDSRIMRLTATLEGKEKEVLLNILNELRISNGMFLWEQGGKDFARDNTKDFNVIKTVAELSTHYKAKYFLGALACLGEEKIKQLTGEIYG